MVERDAYDRLFGQRKAPDGTQLGRPPGNSRKDADIYARLLAAEPHATAERRRELRIEAARQARQGPLFFDLTISLSEAFTLPRLADARAVTRAVRKVRARVSAGLVFQPAVTWSLEGYLAMSL